MSARTGASILWQLIFCTSVPGRHADGVLDGPTSERWIDPWVSYLGSRGVELHNRCEVTEIDCDGSRITGVTLRTPAGPEQVDADYYIAAMPLERLRLLLTDALLEAEPRLRPVQDKKLQIRWMNGIMFYLHDDVPMVHGHILFIDSKWALTAISQKQFWRDIDFAGLGNGQVGGILSVDISDWCTPGKHNGKPARECTRAQIRDEVWAQITRPHPRRLAEEKQHRHVVSRSGHPAPQPGQGDQRRAAAGQHGGLVGQPTEGSHADSQFLSGVRLRPDQHRFGDDGRRQRGRQTRSERHSQGHRFAVETLRSVEGMGAVRIGPIPHVGRGALAPGP